MWCQLYNFETTQFQPDYLKGKTGAFRQIKKKQHTNSAQRPSVAAGTFWIILHPCVGNNSQWFCAATLKLKQNARCELFASVCALSRHANILSPYSKAVPAIIAKASTIYNPFIYAIIHNKYR